MIIKKFDTSKSAVASYLTSITPYTESHSKYNIHEHHGHGIPNNRMFLQNAMGAKKGCYTPYTPYRRIISSHKFPNSSFFNTSNSSKGMIYNLLRWPRISLSINSNKRQIHDLRKSSVYWRQYSQKWSQIISGIHSNKSESILEPISSSHVGPAVNYKPSLAISIHRRAHSVHNRKLPISFISTMKAHTIFTNELIDRKVSAKKHTMKSGETQTECIGKHRILPIHKITIKINPRE